MLVHGVAPVCRRYRRRSHRPKRRSTRHGFSSARRLQGLELAGQQSRRHEMTFSLRRDVRDQFLRAVEIDDADVVPAVHAVYRGRRVSARSRRSRHARPPCRPGRSRRRWPCSQGQRSSSVSGCPALIFSTLLFGMKFVAVLIGPAQPFGELFGNGAFAGAGHAHHHQRARRSCGVHRPRKFSGSAA